MVALSAVTFLCFSLARADGRISTYSSAKPWQRYQPASPNYRRQQATHTAQPRQSSRSDHYLDDDNWITNKSIRPYEMVGQRRMPNQYSWTTKLIFANVLAYGVQSIRPSFTQWGVKLSDRILRGEQLYRLISPVFLHGSIFHLGMNMYSLSNVGGMTESVFGPGRFLAAYLVSGAVGNLVSAVQSPNPALGASGAVFGTMSMFYVFLSRNEWLLGDQGRRFSDGITQTLVINLAFGAMSPNIDNWGHLGGAIGGAAMAYCFGPRLFLAEEPGSRTPLIVDNPVLRMPPLLENIPSNVGKTVASVTQRLQPRRFMPTGNKPWSQKSSRPNYARRRATTGPRSIKPKPID